MVDIAETFYFTLSTYNNARIKQLTLINKSFLLKLCFTFKTFIVLWNPIKTNFATWKWCKQYFSKYIDHKQVIKTMLKEKGLRKVSFTILLFVTSSVVQGLWLINSEFKLNSNSSVKINSYFTCDRFNFGRIEPIHLETWYIMLRSHYITILLSSY